MGEKKDDAPPTVVFKFDMHCQGCAKKIKKFVRRFSGVENFKVDMSANKLTVIGKVDHAKLRDDMAEKFHKKVEIVYPQPKKDAAAGNDEPDDKPEKESDDEKDQDKEPKETEWIKAKKGLQEEKDLSQLLKPECDEIRQSAMRQVEEMELEIVDALHASTEIAERECAKLKSMLEEEKKIVRRLILEKDDELQLAKGKIEESGKELAHARKDAKLARKDAELARKDADAAKNELTKVKREVKEKEKHINLLDLEIQDTRQVTVIQVEDISQELEIAQNELIKAKTDLEEKLAQIQMLKLECQETRERATRQVEEKELELAHVLNAVISTSSSSSVAQVCAICLTNEKDMAFGCGHRTCEECGKTLLTCPICRKDITNRLKLFNG